MITIQRCGWLGWSNWPLLIIVQRSSGYYYWPLLWNTRYTHSNTLHPADCNAAKKKKNTNQIATTLKTTPRPSQHHDCGIIRYRPLEFESSSSTAAAAAASESTKQQTVPSMMTVPLLVYSLDEETNTNNNYSNDTTNGAGTCWETNPVSFLHSPGITESSTSSTRTITNTTMIEWCLVR